MINMEVKFADSFWESLDRMVKRERWYWKTWDFLRYDIPKGVKNIIFFWRVIWNFRPWDHTYNLRIFAKSLEPLRDSIIKGREVDVPRLKKVAKIERAIEILNNITEDKYMEIAESQLGCEMNYDYTFRDDEPEEIKGANKIIRDLSREIEDKEWKELWPIFQGQEHSQYVMLLDKMTPEQRKDDDVWGNWYDGSGMGHWWD
jgi:hypothetical protein